MTLLAQFYYASLRLPALIWYYAVTLLTCKFLTFPCATRNIMHLRILITQLFSPIISSRSSRRPFSLFLARAPVLPFSRGLILNKLFSSRPAAPRLSEYVINGRGLCKINIKSRWKSNSKATSHLRTDIQRQNANPLIARANGMYCCTTLLHACR